MQVLTHMVRAEGSTDLQPAAREGRGWRPGSLRTVHGDAAGAGEVEDRVDSGVVVEC